MWCCLVTGGGSPTPQKLFSINNPNKQRNPKSEKTKKHQDSTCVLPWCFTFLR